MLSNVWTVFRTVQIHLNCGYVKKQDFKFRNFVNLFHFVPLLAYFVLVPGLP